jgi:hypothetical protein
MADDEIKEIKEEVKEREVKRRDTRKVEIKQAIKKPISNGMMFSLMIISVLIGIIVGIAIMSSMSNKTTQGNVAGVGANVVSKNILNFLNVRGVTNASVVDVIDEGQFYRVIMQLPEGITPALVTKDGQILMPIMVNLSEEPLPSIPVDGVDNIQVK